jgi:hypothetical protein
MKTVLCFLLVSIGVLLAAHSYGHFTGKGHVHTLSETKREFLNPACRLTDSCDLKRFTLTTSVYELWFSDDRQHPTYTNGTIMEYETGSTEALERYALVQFKRGCVFYSSRNAQGGIIKKVIDTVPSFGENVPFCFPNWVIDSQDSDPVYNSDPESGRFYFLRWNRPGSYDNRTQKFYGAEKPKTPVVYMADYPSGAFVTDNGVRNVSLEFNTCIYKTIQIPVETQRDNINFAKPLACFNWQNVYVYDFQKARFGNAWADVPMPQEPPTRANHYTAVIFVSGFILLALLSILVWSGSLRQRLRR